jgi:hypothetical protein
LERLEYFYNLELTKYEHYHEYSCRHNKKTTHENVDRAYRMRLKSIEIVLHHLGSKLFPDVKPSLRRSKQLSFVRPVDTDQKRVPRSRGYVFGKLNTSVPATTKAR